MFRRSRFLRAASYCILPALVMAMHGPAYAQDRGQNLKGKFDRINRSLVLDGSAVTSAGNLQMNVTNFGFLGSLPKSSYPMSDSPSAQWPAGSGIEYLYAAGLWVGAEVDGVPSVSTGYPETEFYPPDDPIDIIYKTSEGAKGGRNYPANPDDDGDGRINEDWLNGRDDDGDGLIDEDFAAIGKLMYSCWYTDDQPVARQVWPDHAPLNIKVRQETYQWSEESSYNAVAVHYDIGNQGVEISPERLFRNIRRPRCGAEERSELLQGRPDRFVVGDLVRSRRRRHRDAREDQRALCLRQRRGRGQDERIFRRRASRQPDGPG